jgi:hypothetical protein
MPVILATQEAEIEKSMHGSRSARAKKGKNS